MKIHLYAIGQMKNGPEKSLIEDYSRRLFFPLRIKELICKKSLPSILLKEEEGNLILKEIPEGSPLICLDEHGDNLSSAQFAREIQCYQDKGIKNLSFCIGGANGLSNSVHQRSDRLISFGKLTWPHMLVRVLFLEQIYRAQQILSNHPYHRD